MTNAHLNWLIAFVFCAGCGGGAADSTGAPTGCTASPLAPTAEISGTRVLMQIRPSQLSNCTTMADDPHQVYVDQAVPAKGLLAVFLPGTGASPAQYPSYLQRGSARGYHVIGLTYVNSQAIGELCNAAAGDANCAGKAREEVLTGRDTSSLISVPEADALQTRLLILLLYLAKHRSGEGWNQFINSDNGIAWNKISVGGHSQGAGHAAYIGKTRRVFRVGMYSGPSDWVNASNEPPNWFRLSPVTPASAFYGFIHSPDFIANPVSSGTRVIDAWGSAGLFSMSGTATDVSLVPTPYAASQRLLSRACLGSAFTALNQHNCTMFRGNEAVWDVVSYP